MKRSFALIVLLVSGLAAAVEPLSVRLEPLPTSMPELTGDACERQVPGWQAEFKRIEGEMQKAKTAFEADPSPANEASVLSSVDAFVDAMEILAPIELRCTELQKVGDRAAEQG